MTFLKRVCLFVVLLLLVAGHAVSQSSVVKSMLHNGSPRSYRLYVPAAYNGTAVPLLINMHGYGSNAWEQENYADFRSIADTANFILIHPEGLPGDNGELSWNSSNLTQVNDVDFISKLIDSIAASFNIDEDRVYAAGMSNGGFMAYKLACELSSRVAAIASVTGSMDIFLLTSCQPLHPTPVMQIHGTADAVVPYNGTVYHASVDDLIAHWVAFNGCATNPVVTIFPNSNTDDNCTAERFVYAADETNASVELIKVIGGGHSWPGAPININITNMDFSASAEIWRFFRQFELSDLTGFADVEEPIDFEVRPNPNTGQFKLFLRDAVNRRVVIADVTGRVVIELNKPQLANNILLPSPGLYTITVTNGRTEKSQRVVVSAAP